MCRRRDSLIERYVLRSEVFDLSSTRSQAFDALVAEYAAPIGRLTRVYTAERADQEDLIQEIWLALWQALPRFRGECSQRTFVYRVAHNRALTFRSRQSRSATETLGDDVADPSPDPATNVSREDLSIRLAAAVRRLPKPYREAIALHLEGLSAAEIATITGTTPGNIAVRLTRARDALRQQFNNPVQGVSG